MAGTVANDGKWKSFQNGQVLYGPAGSGQNLNTDLEGNAANDIDSQVAEIVGDATVSGHLVAAGVGLAVTISAGTTYCAGQRVKTTSSGGVGSLPASTSGIKIYVEPMTPWSTTNRAWPANFAFTTGALAAGQVLLATVTTDGSNVTVVTDGRALFGTLGSIGTGGPFLPKTGGTMTGAILFSPDNTVDIGASGATRPRSIYFGTALIGGGTPANTGLVRLPTDAGVMWRNAANTGDIGIRMTGDTLDTGAGSVYPSQISLLVVGAAGVKVLAGGTLNVINGFASMYPGSGNNNFLGYNSAGYLSFQTITSAAFAGNVERLRLSADGSVVLGTPGVVGSAAMIRFSETTATSETFVPRIHQGSTSGTGSDLHIGAGSTSGAIKFFTGALANQTDLLGASSNAVRMTIDSTGQVTLSKSGQAILINGATTGLSYFHFTNTGGDAFVGLGSSALGGLFVGGSAYAASFGSTNATPVELATNNTVRFRVDSTGVSRSLGILSIEGAGGTIGATSVGIELRGSASPSLTAYNRATSAYLNMQYDAGSHEHLISGVVTHRMIGTTADPEFHFQNTGVGSVFHVFKTNSTTRWLLGVASATTKFIFFDGTANRLVLRNGGLMTQIDQDYTATYTPQAQLGTTAAATVGDVQIVGSQTSASADTAVLEFINHAVGTGAEPRLAAIAARRAAANNTGDLAFYTTAAGVITAKVILTSAGVLLVGTAVATGSSAGDITIAQGSSYRSLMSGSTSQVMLRSTSIGGSDVTQLTNGSGSIPVIGAPATVGGAAGGDLVFAGTASIRFANNAGSTTLRGFDKDTSDVFHIAGAGGNVKLVSDTVLIGSSIIALGTTAAATGAIRLQSQDKISSRNAANSADLELLTADSTNRLALGAGTTYVRIVNTLRCDIDSTSRFVLPVGSAKYAT